MTEDELQALLEKTTPERDRYELFVEQRQDQDVRVRFSPAKGEGWATAALLTIAETSLRAAAGPQARVTHLNGTVLRAGQQAHVIPPSRVLRRERDLLHSPPWLFTPPLVAPIPPPPPRPHTPAPLFP